jgi:hypothetical protein
MTAPVPEIMDGSLYVLLYIKLDWGDPAFGFVLNF